MNGKVGAVLGALLVVGAVGCAGSASVKAQPPAPSARVTAGRPACEPKGSGFALSLASSVGGEATPERAALAFARRSPTFGEPLSGWHIIAQTEQGATVQSGHYQLHTVQGPDGTWQVDSGRCV